MNSSSEDGHVAGCALHTGREDVSHALADVAVIVAWEAETNSMVCPDETLVDG